MSARPPQYSWADIGYSYDPVPGDSTVVTNYGNEFKRIADAITRATTRLDAIVDDHTTEAEFIDAFRDKAKDVRKRIGKAHDRYQEGSEALLAYAPVLESTQNEGDAALRMAQNAENDYRTAQIHIQTYTKKLAEPDITPTDKTHYTALLHQAQKDATAAQHAQQNAAYKLQQAIDDRQKAGQTAADKFGGFQKHDGLKDGWNQNWVQFWEENGGWIDTAIQILGWVAAIACVVLLFIPGVNLIVITIIGIVMAAITIANAWMQYSAGTKSLGMAIFSTVAAVVSVALPFAGKAVSGVAARGVEEVAATSIMKSAAGQGISGVTRTVATETAEEIAETGTMTVANRLVTAADVAENLAKIQALRDAAILVDGVAPRVVAAADSVIWKLSLIPNDLVYKVIETGVEGLLEPILEGGEGEEG